MKKLHLFAFLLMTSTAVSTFSLRVVAQTGKDCPPVPKEGTKVVIDNDQAFIRKSPKADGKTNLAYVAAKNSSLELLTTKPLFEGKNCWYQVKLPEGRTEKELWVADENFSPFPKADARTKESSVNDPSGGQTLDGKSQKKTNDQTLNLHDWSSIGLGILFFLGFLTTGIFLYKLLKRLNNLEQKINSELTPKIISINTEVLKTIPKITTIQQNTESIGRRLDRQNQSLSSLHDAFISVPSTIIVQFNESLKSHLLKLHDNNESIKKDIRAIHQKIEERQNSDKGSSNTDDGNNAHAEDSNPVDDNQSTQETDPFPQSLNLSDAMREIIKEFNNYNQDYFRNFSRFKTLKLSKKAIQGEVGIDGNSIALEPTTDEEEMYLEFYLDGSNWLIPNIKSQSFQKILVYLENKREIFIPLPGGISNKRELVEPAKLKSISSELWTIVEPGKLK